LLYNELAGAYGGGPVSKLSDDYKKFIGQPESTESKLVLANLNQAIDRQSMLRSCCGAELERGGQESHHGCAGGNL
jgi:hypothetical protein